MKELLRSPDRLFWSEDVQFAIHDLDYEGIANVESEGVAQRGGDDDTSVR